jgi:hypothetical protein
METWKVVAAYAAWLLAAATISLLVGLLLGELVLAVGLVDAASTQQRIVVEAVAVAGFLVLAALPYLLRRRVSGEVGDGDE